MRDWTRTSFAPRRSYARAELAARLAGEGAELQARQEEAQRAARATAEAAQRNGGLLARLQSEVETVQRVLRERQSEERALLGRLEALSKGARRPPALAALCRPTTPLLTSGGR